MILKLIFCFLLCSSAVLAEEAITSYEGYKVYDVNAQNAFAKEALLRLSSNEAYDFFDLPRQMGAAARVMVPPKEQPEFESTLNRFGLNFKIINENFGKSIELEREENERMKSSTSKERIAFNAFLRFSEINDYIDSLAKSFPNRVSVKTVGKSYENRDMKTITITNGDGKTNKKVILVDAGIHAREWIAHSGVLYIIHQLVENFSANSHLLANYDWIILPVVNPDGYEYTHTSTRMWRKTRKPVSSLCSGTDGNRNFDFHWGEVGASSQACMDTFKGKTAFSEPETQVLRDLMHSVSDRAKFYLTLHSYGNYLLYPWGWTSSLPDTWQDLDTVAQAGAAAIKKATGTVYSVGSSTNVLYAAAGGSDDYAFAKANIPISITMELPAGGSGFDPTPAQIEPFVSETWIGIKAMAEKVIEMF